MSEYRQQEPEKIDLASILTDFLHGFRKLWWLVIGLSMILAMKEYLTVSENYRPRYVAEATMAVRCVGNDWDYLNEATAEHMAEVFPYILRSGILQNKVAREMDLDYLPGSLSMSAEAGTNFFTISAEAGDPEQSYALLQATLKCYPEIAEIVIGEIEVEVLDETGIPSDTGRASAIRGSFRKGAVVGAAIGFCIVVLYVFTRNTIKRRKDLKRIVNLKDLGSLPCVREKKRRNKKRGLAINIGKDRVPFYYLEAMRKLRVRVGKEMEENNFRSLLVTSSVPGEGKTTVAVNLALSYVKQGKRVILVDCDMRTPSVAKFMGAEGEYPGIGAVLRREVTLANALKEVTVDGKKMQVLYASKADNGVSQLLGKDIMHKFVTALEKYADIIIFDVAPSELLADATILARNIDAALYVVKCDHAKKNRIQDGVQALSESGIKILGYVFNADTSKQGGGYGYGYGYKRYGSYYGYGYGYYGKRKDDDLSGRVIKD